MQETAKIDEWKGIGPICKTRVVIIYRSKGLFEIQLLATFAKPGEQTVLLTLVLPYYCI